MKLGEAKRTRTDERCGKRVELPAFADQWMRGARFGVVRSVVTHPDHEDILEVKCDHPGIRRLYRHHASNFRFLP